MLESFLPIFGLTDLRKDMNKNEGQRRWYKEADEAKCVGDDDAAEPV